MNAGIKIKKHLLLLRFLVFTLLGSVLLVFVFRRINTSGIVNINVNWLMVAAGICAAVIAQTINGFRIRVSLMIHGSVTVSIAISSVHQLWLNLLPLRSGELSFVLLGRRYTGCTADTAIAGLGQMRIFDLFAFTLMGFISAFFAFLKQRQLFTIFLTLTGILLLVIIVLLTGIVFMRMLKKKGEQTCFLSRFSNRIIAIINSFNLINDTAAARMASLTLFYWVATFLFSYCVFRSFYPLGYGNYLLLFTALNLFAMLPVHGFLNLGTTEYANICVLQLMGLTEDTAALAAVACHITLLSVVTILGLVGYVILLYVRSGKLPGNESCFNSTSETIVK